MLQGDNMTVLCFQSTPYTTLSSQKMKNKEMSYKLFISLSTAVNWKELLVEAEVFFPQWKFTFQCFSFNGVLADF